MKSAPATGAAGSPATSVYRPPYLAAGIAALAVWLLYALTLAPTTAFWDTSEYIATAHILGIPHPPGNPLFVVLARAWDVLLEPTRLPTAVRINLFSATMSALAHGCWFLLAHRILAFYSESRAFRLAGAAAAVVISATAFTVWNQSNVNEKVYTVSLFTIALLSWLAFRWRDRLGVGKDDNLLLLMVFILALSVGNHLMAFLAAPALFVFVLLVHPRTFLNWKLYAAGAVAVILGLSIHLFLPIRAAEKPIINEADPQCPSFASALASVVTMGYAGCEDLSASLTRQQYDKPSMFVDPTNPARPRSARLFAAQLANYFQYFDWQWGRSIDGLDSWFNPARVLFTGLFLALGLAGLTTHYREDRISFVYVATLFVTLAFGLVFYLNFRYGYSVPQALLRSAPTAQPIGELREVRERDYFFIVSFSLWGLWSGIGLAAIWRDLTERLTHARPDAHRPLLTAAPVLGLALLPLIFNWSWASRANDYTARDWAYNLLNSVEPYGILFTNGDNDTFPLWYLQEVEGIRQDVTVMVMSYLNTPWYARQIRDLTASCQPGEDPLQDPTIIVCQRPFNADRAPAFYGNAMVPTDMPGIVAGDVPPGQRAPTHTILPLSNDEIRDIANQPPYYIERPQVFAAGQIEAVLPAGTVVLPADAFMVLMVREAINDRPVYYAMTTQAYENLQLQPFLIRQGVAFKLNNGPVEPDSTRGIFATPAGDAQSLIGPYIDLPRTRTLVDSVFVHRGGFPERWSRWVDAATEGIPFYYAYTDYGLAVVLEQLGDTTAAAHYVDSGDAFLRLGALRRQGS